MPKKNSSRLIFLDAQEASLEHSRVLEFLPVQHHSSEGLVWQNCGAAQPAVEAVFAASDVYSVLKWLVKPVVKWLVKFTDDRLQEEIKKYAAVFEGSTPGFDFYVEGGDGAGHPKLAKECFAFTHYSKHDEGRVEMDLVGQLRTVGTSLQVRPLRLYYTTPDAKTAAEVEDKYPVGVAVSISADATWYDQHGPREKENVFVSERFLTATLQLSATDNGPKLSEPHYHIYRTDDWDEIPEHGQIPWSSYGGAEFGPSRTTFKIDVAEAGKPKWLRKKLTEWLHDNKDDVVEKLVEAATDAIDDLENPEP